MTSPTPTPPPSSEAIKASFGFVGAMAAAIPELRGILDQAVREQWTTDRFIMAVSASGWYKSNSDKAREWLTLQTVDPATAQRKHWLASNEMQTRAMQLGMTLTQSQWESAATWRILNPEASDDYLNLYLTQTFFDPYQDWAGLSGRAAGLAGEIQEIGRAYGWDDFDHYNESRDWLGKIMQGKDTIDGFRRKMLDYAKVRYPGLHDQLLAGMTVRDVADPYMDVYSNILEVSKSAINWYDDRLVQRALQYRPPSGGDGGTGVQSNGAMPIYEFEKVLREDPRWQKTNNARDAAVSVIERIGRDWGFYGR